MYLMGRQLRLPDAVSSRVYTQKLVGKCEVCCESRRNGPDETTRTIGLSQSTKQIVLRRGSEVKCEDIGNNT